MDQPHTSAETLPAHIRRFAPWTWRRRWLVVPVLLLAYPLSLGPMVWLSDRQPLPQWTHEALEAIYLPLFLVIQTDWGEATLGRYVGLWESLP